MTDPDLHMESEAGEPTDSEAKPPEASIPSCVHLFRQGTKNHLLTAVVKPGSERRAGFSSGEIKGWIRYIGCGGWFTRDETIMQLARESRNLQSQKEYIIAERKDCQIEIHVSPDRLKAWLRITPGYGGEPLSEDLLRKEFTDRNICYGIKEEQVQQIVSDGSCERVLIAEGIAPIQGEPARFERLAVESEHKGIPQERENGTVDYKDLGLFLSVQKGEPLLRRIPPTEGTPGTSIDGKVIPANSGPDRSLMAGVGTAVSPEDSNLVIANRVGQPSYLENSVRVDPTLEIESVDPSTGNVIFEGNILVRGCVESGFSVKAGQDLIILDTVEGANLSAGKNITLLTGIYGKSKAAVTAGGNLEARFLSDCTVRCDGNIEVADLIAHCDVECGGTLSIGKQGGKGQGFGGKLIALRGMQAQILGSVSETPTMVEVAVSRPLLLQEGRTEALLELASTELAAIEKELKAAEDAGSMARINDLKKKQSIIEGRIEEITRDQETIRSKMLELHKAKIKAAEVHRGVTLCIGSEKHVVADLLTDVCLQYPIDEKDAH